MWSLLTIQLNSTECVHKKMTNWETTTNIREQFKYLILPDAKGSHNEIIQFSEAQKM